MNARISNAANTIATEEACADVEQFAGWIESAPEDREMSTYWGPISTPDLVRTMLSGMANAEQCEMVCRDLRERYLKEFSKQIEQRAQELSI
jgi:maltose-binding protein MalE